MDKILITSRMFSDYLQKEFEIKEERIEYLPQYAEDFEPIPPKEENGILTLCLPEILVRFSR